MTTTVTTADSSDNVTALVHDQAAAFPVIDRTPGSEATRPDIAIAATPAGNESVYVGPLTNLDGTTAHLRVGRQGFRVLFQNASNGEWHCVRSMHCNVRGINLGTASVSLASDLKTRLEGLGFELDDASVAFLDSLPNSAATVYSAAREQRSVLAAEYLPETAQTLREYSAGASKFRGF